MDRFGVEREWKEIVDVEQFTTDAMIERLPPEVGGRILLRDVYGLKNLKGLPRSTRHEQLEIRHCDIKTLEGIPSDTDDVYVALSRIKSLKGLPKDTMTSLAIGSEYLESIDHCPREITDWVEFAVSITSFESVKTLPREIGNGTLRFSITNVDAQPDLQYGKNSKIDAIVDQIAALNQSYITRVMANGKKYATVKGK